jgi:tRNA modification GTPase
MPAMNNADTIAAISSAVGAPAGRAIVRVSGPEAHRIAGALADALPSPGGARQGTLRFADPSVPAWVYLFARPRSYTGEDLVEFHVPGSALLARMLLAALVAAGARHAEPGEFTARAYFSGRLDLSEAEGVAATIAAHGEQELRAARQLMAGELSRRLRPAMDLLAETLALVEAGIDFSDEGVSFLSAEDVGERVRRIDAVLDELVASSARFEPLTHEPAVVLVGRPNAGKSTLLNALAGHERAVVSAVAGTTRDVLSAEVRLARGLVRVLDVAGLEQETAPGEGAPARSRRWSAKPQAAGCGVAEIARQMRARALRAIEEADYVVLVRDATDQRPTIDLSREPDLIVRTKSDLVPPEVLVAREPVGDISVAGARELPISAVTGENLDLLRARLDDLAFGSRAAAAAAPTLALNARHLGSIAEAREALERAAAIVATGGAELVALELREGLDALGRVLGQVTPDDVLGRIFSTFCIGK